MISPRVAQSIKEAQGQQPKPKTQQVDKPKTTAKPDGKTDTSE
jgi:hypothetical protein